MVDAGSPDGSGATTDGGGAATDGASGAVVDSPGGMVKVVAATTFCVDQTQSGADTWTNAAATCEARSARLCADLEWHAACLQAGTLSLVDMVGDYEWVAELVTPTDGGKRGSVSCEARDLRRFLRRAVLRGSLTSTDDRAGCPTPRQMALGWSCASEDAP